MSISNLLEEEKKNVFYNVKINSNITLNDKHRVFCNALNYNFVNSEKPLYLFLASNIFENTKDLVDLNTIDLHMISICFLTCSYTQNTNLGYGDINIPDNANYTISDIKNRIAIIYRRIDKIYSVTPYEYYQYYEVIDPKTLKIFTDLLLSFICSDNHNIYLPSLIGFTLLKISQSKTDNYSIPLIYDNNEYMVANEFIKSVISNTIYPDTNIIYSDILEKYKINKQEIRTNFVTVDIIKKIIETDCSKIYRVKFDQTIISGNLEIKKYFQKKMIMKKTVDNYFQLESDIIRRLEHENIITIVYSNYNSYIMECCDTSLEDIIYHNIRYPLQLRIKFMTRIINAVRYMHTKGFVHMDLKPTNILIGLDLEPKIIDFDRTITQQYSGFAHIGTFDYLPYEYFTGNSIFNHFITDDNFYLLYKIDIWSLGCIFYELLRFEMLFCYDDINNPTEYIKERLESRKFDDNEINIFRASLNLDPNTRCSIKKLQKEIFNFYEINKKKIH